MLDRKNVLYLKAVGFSARGRSAIPLGDIQTEYQRRADDERMKAIREKEARVAKAIAKRKGK